MSFYWDDKENFKKVEKHLKNNDLVLASTDTVLGLLGSLNKSSFEALNFMKKRSGKPYLINISSQNSLKLFTDQKITEILKELMELVWPGPFTLIFKARKDLPDFMKSDNGTVAVRVPDHKELLKLLKSFDGLFSTSANISGELIPHFVKNVDSKIYDNVGGTVIERDREDFSAMPSTVLDCSGDSIKLVRSGNVISDEIKKYIGEIIA